MSMYNEDRFAPRNGWSNYPTWYAAEIVSGYEDEGLVDEAAEECKSIEQFEGELKYFIGESFESALCDPDNFMKDMIGYFYSNVNFEELARFFWGRVLTPGD